MRLHQLKIDFAAEQDRMLMLIAASEKVEVRMWLTRRFVKLLWPLLVKLAEEASPRIRTQPNPEARKALLNIEHEQAVSKANFAKPYDDSARATPLGAEPLLLARIQTGHDPNGHPVLAMHPSEGQGVTLTLDPVLLHSPAAGGGEEERLGHGTQAARRRAAGSRTRTQPADDQLRRQST